VIDLLTAVDSVKGNPFQLLCVAARFVYQDHLVLLGINGYQGQL
jgi:hypothetical protein